MTEINRMLRENNGEGLVRESGQRWFPTEVKRGGSHGRALEKGISGKMNIPRSPAVGTAQIIAFPYPSSIHLESLKASFLCEVFAFL